MSRHLSWQNSSSCLFTTVCSFVSLSIRQPPLFICSPVCLSVIRLSLYPLTMQLVYLSTYNVVFYPCTCWSLWMFITYLLSICIHKQCSNSWSIFHNDSFLWFGVHPSKYFELKSIFLFWCIALFYPSTFFLPILNNTEPFKCCKFLEKTKTRDKVDYSVMVCVT